MATLSVSGIGSGLDVEGIVSQLMLVERIPLNTLVSKQQDLEAELSAFGQLRSALSSFEDAMNGLSSLAEFQTFKAETSGGNADEEGAFSALASSDAAPGSYSVNVVQLAQAHKVNATGAYSGETGTLTIDVGGDSFDITVDTSNNTLEGMRDAINNAGDNTGVTATIVNSDAGQQLLLTANDTGTANTIATSGSVGTVLNFQTVAGNDPLDAIVDIDGFTITNSSNVIDGAVDGLTLTLNQETTAAQTLTVSTDLEAAQESVQAFADAYNNLVSTIRSVGGEGGELQGDSALLSVERRVQSILNTPASGLDYQYLSDIGITTTDSGTLAVNDSELEAALTTNFSGVASLFTDSSQGFAARFETLADTLLETDGLLDGREDTLNDQIADNQDDQEDLEYRLTLIEERYRAQFYALDALVAQLSATGDFLTGQLALLPNA